MRPDFHVVDARVDASAVGDDIEFALQGFAGLEGKAIVDTDDAARGHVDECEIHPGVDLAAIGGKQAKAIVDEAVGARV